MLVSLAMLNDTGIRHCWRLKLDISSNLLQFTSIVFRNVTFTGLPNNLLFELKVEVRFTNVKVEGDVFNLDFEVRY